MACLLAGIAVILAWVCSPAWADGDPASDVLAQQSLFLPQDAGLGPSRQSELTRLVQEAGRSGYRVRVAVIASSTDLGSVTELWNQPQLYARFLGQELSLVYRGPLIVVMPAGVGVSIAGQPRTPPSVSHLRPTPQADLGAVALSAVQRVAATAGVQLAVPSGTSTSGSTSADATAWLVFAAGGALIAAAWALSLRARPPTWWRTSARAVEPPASQ